MASSSSSSSAQILSRAAIPSLIQQLDASDVLEVYHLTRHAPLHFLESNSTFLQIKKMALGIRYRPLSISSKPPLELTLEYGPQRFGVEEGLPMVMEDSIVTWQNEAKVYYTTSSLASTHRWESAYFMASMTGTVLQKLLGKAVDYPRTRYQPFSVLQEDRVVLRSSNSQDFLEYLWQELASLGVEISPILPPPSYEVRLHVDGIEKVASTEISSQAVAFYQKLIKCVTAIATGDYSDFEPPTLAPTVMPINDGEDEEDDVDGDGDVDGDDGDEEQDGVGDDTDGQDEDDIDDKEEADEDGDDQEVVDDEEELDDEVEDADDRVEDDEDANEQVEDDVDEDDGDQEDDLDEDDENRRQRSLSYWQDTVQQLSGLRSNSNAVSSRARLNSVRSIEDAQVDKDDSGLLDDHDNDVDEQDGGTATDISNASSAPSTAPVEDEAEQANKAAQEAKEAAAEAKEAATTEADSKAAQAAEAAANAAQKAADATSLKKQQVAMENILSGDGVAMSTSVVTCFTNPQYHLTTEKDENDTTTVTTAYLYLDGATYYRLNLTWPYLDVVRVERPLPASPLLTFGNSGGDVLDWTLLIVLFCFMGIGIVLMLQRIGFRFLPLVYKIQKWFFSPTEEDYDLEDIGGARGQGFEHAFGEDVIPLSMGGRRPTSDYYSKPQAVKNSGNGGLDNGNDDHAGDLEMVGEMRSRTPQSRSRSGSRDSEPNHGRRLSGLDLDSRLARDPDLVDLPNLSSKTKVAIPVSIEHARSQSSIPEDISVEHKND